MSANFDWQNRAERLEIARNAAESERDTLIAAIKDALKRLVNVEGNLALTILDAQDILKLGLAAVSRDGER